MTKMNRNERIDTLANNGIDTSKYFNFKIDKELPKGTTITISIGEDGQPKVDTKFVMDIMKKIDDEGYVKNSSLFRRWVMAQTFRMMRYEGGYTAALNAKPYSYQWEMLERELKAMAKIEKEDKKQFEVRKDFFTKEVILAMFEDYKKKWIERASKYHWYTATKAEAVGIANITIGYIMTAENYTNLYHYVKEFNTEVKTGRPSIALPRDTQKCKEWVDAYKGAGAYYSLDNMFKYHLAKDNIRAPFANMVHIVNRTTALALLEQRRKEYKGEWYKLFGFFKEVVRVNNFNFEYEMYKKYHTSVMF